MDNIEHFGVLSPSGGDIQSAPTVSCDEFSPLLKTSENTNYVEERNKEGEEEKNLENSDLHRNKDFQLIEVPRGRSLFSFKKLWKFTGPGFLMSIAYLDPGNIEGDLQVGAVTQYKLLWVLLWSTFMGLSLQLLSAKLGIVTGKHLAQVCRERYPRVPRYILWISMELAIIGSDIQEVIGSALAINILSQGTIPLWEGCLITAIDTFTFLFLESYGLRYLEAFFCFLITVMCVMFGWMYVYTGPNQVDIIKGIFIPYCSNCSNTAVKQGLGLVGAVIMPHNLYLHSGLVLSRAISRSSRDEVFEGIKYNYIESSIALLISFFVNLFIICVFGASVYSYNYPPGVDNCGPDTISLLSAGDCLLQRYGNRQWIKYVWALGLLAAGQSSTMTGTYAGQFVMEGFLDIKWAKWKRVLLTRSISIVPCVIIAISAMNSLDYLDEYINIEQSLLLPFSLLPLLHATSSKDVMKGFINPWWRTLYLWVVGGVVMLVNVYFIIDVVAIPGRWWRHLSAGVGLLIYLFFVLYFAVYPLVVKLMEKLEQKRRNQ